jgi:hypothetical protein
VINLVRARGSNLWRFLANGKKTIRKNIVVFKLIIESLEGGWVQPSSIGTPQHGGRQVLYLAEPWDKPLCLLLSFSVIIVIRKSSLYSHLVLLHSHLYNQTCGYLVLNFTRSPIHPPPLGALSPTLGKGAPVGPSVGSMPNVRLALTNGSFFAECQANRHSTKGAPRPHARFYAECVGYPLAKKAPLLSACSFGTWKIRSLCRVSAGPALGKGCSHGPKCRLYAKCAAGTHQRLLICRVRG